MAIQNRRGVYSDFTPSKMVPGELAVVQSGDPNNTSGKAVYAAFGASGDVKRLASEDDLSGKVDKVTGKGLSTNDYTTAEKNKLSGIEAQANKTVIDSTLTQTGQAADAKAVGDAIDSVTIETDKTLTEEDVPADAKVVGDELADVKSDLNEKASAIISSASGSIAHFEDGSDSDAVDVIAYINPVQDLHGYDNPWPAGGGKNLFNKDAYTASDISPTYNSSGELNAASKSGFRIDLAPGTYTASMQVNQTSHTYLNILNSNDEFVGFLSLSTTNLQPPKTFTIGEGEHLIMFKGSSGGSLAFRSADIMIEVGDVAHDYEPYENICPISGFTGMNIKGTGKNLVSYLNDRTNNGITFTYDQETGSYHVSGTASSGAWSDVGISASAVVNYSKLHAGTYIVSGFNDNVTGRVQAWYNDNTDETLITTVRESTTFTLTHEAYVYLRAYVGADKTVDETLYPMIRFASDTDGTFEPYKGSTYPIAFPAEAGTVYGGYVDVTKGKLVVDKVKHTLPTTGYTKLTTTDPDNNVWSRGRNNVWSEVPVGYGDGYIGCNLLKPTRVASAGDHEVNTICIYNSSNNYIRICLPKSVADTNEELETWLTNNPVEVVYEVVPESVQAYDITPTQIALLLGANNVWNDTNGDTDVEYRSDTKLYIEQLTKPTEDDMTANTNIASGKFFMIGNRLFLSVTAIASGATIVPGTNCTELSLADALNNLNT